MNVPTITIEEPKTAVEELKDLQAREAKYQLDNQDLKDQVCALREENEVLKVRCEELMKMRDEARRNSDAFERQLAEAKENTERAYLRGRIDGLEFAVRCNGVSGAEVSGH